MSLRDSAEPRYAVVSPLGRTRIESLGERKSLPTVDGKTIGFIWDYLFKGNEMFQAIERMAAARYRDPKFVAYEKFGNVHGSAPEERANIAAIADRVREAQIDAVVVAVGA